MKKLLMNLVMVILLIPTTCLAVTCDVDDYSAEVKIDKNSISLGDKAFISVSSNFDYNVEYKSSIKDMVNIDENGVITSLKDGQTNIGVTVNFLADTLNEEIVKSCTVNLALEVLSNDASLKSLNLEELDISAIFQSDKYVYDITLPYKYDSVNILAEANSSSAKISGAGKRYLNEGLNAYSIIVSAPNGNNTIYKVNITREEANSDTTLESLVVEGYLLTPQFSSNIKKYQLDVDKSVDEITIAAKPTYNFATVLGTGKFTLASGKSKYYVTVISESGTQERYEIEINKNNGTSKLSKLAITDYDLSPNFNPDVYLYNVTVKNDVYKLDIKTENTDNEQIEIIGNENFKVGENEVIIRLTSEDKTNTTYKILVNKLSAETEKIIKKNTTLLKILLVLFIVSVIIMAGLIGIFIKRNTKKSYKLKKRKKVRSTRK